MTQPITPAAGIRPARIKPYSDYMNLRRWREWFQETEEQIEQDTDLLVSEAARGSSISMEV